MKGDGIARVVASRLARAISRGTLWLFAKLDVVITNLPEVDMILSLNPLLSLFNSIV